VLEARLPLREGFDEELADRAELLLQLHDLRDRHWRLGPRAASAACFAAAEGARAPRVIAGGEESTGRARRLVRGTVLTRRKRAAAHCNCEFLERQATLSGP